VERENGENHNPSSYHTPLHERPSDRLYSRHFAKSNDFPGNWVQKQIGKQLSADDLLEAGIESMTTMKPIAMMHQLADMAYKDSLGRRADFE